MWWLSNQIKQRNTTDLFISNNSWISTDIAKNNSNDLFINNNKDIPSFNLIKTHLISKQENIKNSTLDDINRQLLLNNDLLMFNFIFNIIFFFIIIFLLLKRWKK